MHLLDIKTAIFFCFVASLTYAQQPTEADEHLVARAPASATANGALDLLAFDPPAKVETPEHHELEAKSSGAKSSPAPDDSTEHVDAQSTVPVPAGAEKGRTAAVTSAGTPAVTPEVTATVSQAVPSQNTRSIVPKGRGLGRGQRLVRDAKAPVPWYRTPYLTLLVVLGLIVAVSVAFKRWVPAARQVSPDTMRVLGRVALAAKHSAVLLHVGRRVVLVGLSADTVSTLAEIRDADEVAALLGQSAQAKASAGFEKTLAREIEAYPEDLEPQGETTSVDEDLLAKTQGQLHGLLSKLRAMQSTPSA